MYDDNNPDQHSPEPRYGDERFPANRQAPQLRPPSAFALPPSFYVRIVIAAVVITIVSEFIDRLLRVIH